MRTHLEILAAIARTYDDDDHLISARMIDGKLTTATFIGLVSIEKRFFIPRAERVSIAMELRQHGFTEWDFERLQNGLPVRHGPFQL